jgi:hypothetical protein
MHSQAAQAAVAELQAEVNMLREELKEKAKQVLHEKTFDFESCWQ